MENMRKLSRKKEITRKGYNGLTWNTEHIRGYATRCAMRARVSGEAPREDAVAEGNEADGRAAERGAGEVELDPEPAAGEAAAQARVQRAAVRADEEMPDPRQLLHLRNLPNSIFLKVDKIH